MKVYFPVTPEESARIITEDKPVIKFRDRPPVGVARRDGGRKDEISVPPN